MALLTYDFDRAARFENFAEAAQVGQRFVDGPDFFDIARIEIQCQGDHWTVKLSEGTFTPRWFAKSALDD